MPLIITLALPDPQGAWGSEGTVELIPNTNYGVEFTITPEKKIILPDGSETDAISLRRSPQLSAFDALPRGMMLMSENPDFWDLVRGTKCFASYPAGSGGEDETWFSAEHAHDKGAIAP